MEQSRYRDKAYLVTYELTTDIFDMFDIKVEEIVPVRSLYILYTDRGVKILKKVNYSLEELEFVNSVLEHVCRNGFKNVVRFLKTREDGYYFRREDGIYVVLDPAEGREADFQNPADIVSISKALCGFHNAASHIGSVSENRNSLYKRLTAFEKGALELLKFKEIAELHQIKTGFDLLFLKYIDRYYNESVKSVELLKSSAYEELCGSAASERGICLHNLAFYNIIVDNCGAVYFLDLDSCALDLRIHDIGDLIVSTIKNNSWDLEKAGIILSNYHQDYPLSLGELETLYAMLVFPQDFYDICRSYYMKTKNWDEEDFLAKLHVKTEYYNDRKKFLEGFKTIASVGFL